jgi:hypothetical protein
MFALAFVLMAAPAAHMTWRRLPLASR